MDYGDYFGGLFREYYRDPFPHSLLSTRQLKARELLEISAVDFAPAARLRVAEVWLDEYKTSGCLVRGLGFRV